MSNVWRNHTKHVLVFSYAGKPIFSRYGELGAQSGIASVATALLMKSIELGDTLRTIRTDDCTVLILARGPLTLLAIIRTGESLSAVTELLRAIHCHIIFVLTSKATQRLADKPNFDLRGQLVGTSGSMLNLIRYVPYTSCPVHFVSGLSLSYARCCCLCQCL